MKILPYNNGLFIQKKNKFGRQRSVWIFRWCYSADKIHIFKWFIIRHFCKYNKNINLLLIRHYPLEANTNATIIYLQSWLKPCMERAHKKVRLSKNSQYFRETVWAREWKIFKNLHIIPICLQFSMLYDIFQKPNEIRSH